MNILYYIIMCYGITLILVQSRIMEPIRLFFKKRITFIYLLLNCMMCTSFWVGFIGSLTLNFSPTYNTLGLNNINLSYFILDGFFISGSVWLIYLIQLNLERYVKDEL